MIVSRRVTVIASAVALAAASPAAAQDVRVEVIVPRTIVRDVQRVVRQAIDREVIREVTAAIAAASVDVASVVRQRQGGVAAASRAQFPVERDHRETRTIRLGADGWLDLTNMSGDILVEAGTGTMARVEIHRVSRGRTEADAERGLQQVQVEVSERGGTRASIETRHEPQRNPPYRVSVSYTITVPRGTRLAIRNMSGSVTTRGIRGDQEIDVVSGDIEILNGARISSAKAISGSVTIAGAETTGMIDAGSAAGSVTLRDIRARRLHASVVTGGITAQNVTCDEAELTSMVGPIEFHGPLAQRGRYSLQTYSGQIRFLPTGRVGFDLRAETYGGMISIEPSGTVPTSGARRSIRSTLGDGGAAVILQSFSGRIEVIRR
jgi:DUF4097 and DUF4098 domain-containing protein YvlB